MAAPQIANRLEVLLSASMAPSSLTVYKRAWALFQRCMSSFRLPNYNYSSLPVAPAHLATFISYLSCNGFASSTIISYTSAIGYAHRLSGTRDPTSSYLIQKLLAGATRLSPSMDTRLPITGIVLNMLINSLQTAISNQYDAVMLRAMFSVSYFGLMRVGEVTSTTYSRASVFLQDLTLTPSYATIAIRKFKHNTGNRPFDIVLPAQSSAICPVAALQDYLQFRGYASGPLFIFPDGSPVPRNFFVSRLRQCLIFAGLDPTLYKSHSFRIGGASHYAELGYSDSQIRLLGRWKSDAFKRYIRSQRIHPPSF